MRQTGFEYAYEVEPYSLLWLGSALGLSLYAKWAHYTYVQKWQDDIYQFPLDTPYDPETDWYDNDWVLNQPETLAWKEVSYVIGAISTGYWLIWFANYSLDNEGGTWHEIYWHTAQVSRFMPLVIAYEFWQMMTSYHMDYLYEYNELF